MDISVTVPRLPAPGATVLGGAAAFAPGGKGANQAVAAARLGGGVRMVGCVGDDDFGGALRAALRADGVDDDGVRAVPGVPTGLAMITVDETGENIITVAPGANREVGGAEIAAVRDSAADVLVISAEVPVAAIRAALAALAESRALRVLNLAPAPPEAAELVAAGVDWLVVNESEAAAVLGQAGGRPGGRGRGGGGPGAGRRAQRGGHRRRGRRGVLRNARRAERRNAGCGDGAGVPGAGGGYRRRRRHVRRCARGRSRGRDRAAGGGRGRRRGGRRRGHQTGHSVRHAESRRRPRRHRPRLAGPGSLSTSSPAPRKPPAPEARRASESPAPPGKTTPQALDVGAI